MADNANNNDKWTCERFVAFLDIMGFKNKLLVDGHDDVKKMLMTLHQVLKPIEKIGEINKLKEKMQNVDSRISSGAFPIFFSDSIILISSDKSSGSLLVLLRYIEYVFREAISKEIPMKGAIAFSKVTADLDNSIFFGQPLIDAFELQNQLQLYGVVLHNTVEKRFNESDTHKSIKKYDIFRYPVSMKTGKIMHYVVDWTKLLGLAANEDAFEIIEKLYKNVSGKPRIYVDNTLAFLREITKNKAETLLKIIP
jgi:hypothetical protein